MKKIMVIAIPLILILVSSCGILYRTESNFTLTGKARRPLAENSAIKVILNNKDVPEYDEIGVVQVIQNYGENDLSEAVEEAKMRSREYGGDVIILLSLNNRKSLSESDDEVTTTQTRTYYFTVGKLK